MKDAARMSRFTDQATKGQHKMVKQVKLAKLGSRNLPPNGQFFNNKKMALKRPVISFFCHNRSALIVSCCATFSASLSRNFVNCKRLRKQSLIQQTLKD